MSELFRTVTGMDLPDGVPLAVAISIATSGMSESEARRMIMIECDRDEAEGDEWIEKMRSAGFFGMGQNSSPMQTTASQDAAKFLWNELKRELQQDESDFKHRIVVFDNEVKRAIGNDLTYLAAANASYFIPFYAMENRCPWNGCKFVASTVLLFVTGTKVTSKRKAIAPVSYSLGGCTIPSDAVLSATRWPYVLSNEFAKAELAAQSNGTCTALHIVISDVEIMRNPEKRGLMFAMRPGTFAHTCVMTVSPVGVYLFQGYGPHGYTLLQNIEEHDATYPLSFVQAEAWIKHFEEFSAEQSGVWTREVNDAYAHCFNVDLVGLGTMRIGSQLDAYFQVYAHEFDIALVRKNFALLPKRDVGGKNPCRDGVQAKSMQHHPEHVPDGGVKHYYVPVVLRCGFCGSKHSSASKRCAACKKVYYCNKKCQTKDWKLRHKKVCKSLAP